MIRHQIFFEVLAQILEDAPEWEPIICGYLTMGLFDTWVRVGPVGVANDSNVGKIQERVEALTGDYEGEREALLEVLRTFLAAAGAEPRYVAEAVMGYGVALEWETRWSLAIDVYRTLAESIEIDARSSEKDFAFASHARRKEGFCWRNLQNYAGAETAYLQAIELGKRADDTNAQIYAKLGRAITRQIRGNYTGLIKEIDELLRDCKPVSSGLAANLHADLLHVRGSANKDLKLYNEALVDYFAAYNALQTSNASAKDFILVDIGLCAADAGFWKSARDALNVVALTTKNRFAKQVATINLMNVAIELEDQKEFERQRNSWQPEHCDPKFNAAARLYIALALEKFESIELAITAFHEAADFAKISGIHHIQFQALQEIERLEGLVLQHHTKVVVHNPIAQSMPESLKYIAGVLSEMNALAVASCGA